jgi:hypothetical protein
MKTPARMTVEEFREVMEEAVERKLTEMLGDPDKGRTLRATVERRLTRSLRASRQGERGVPAVEVAERYEFKREAVSSRKIAVRSIPPPSYGGGCRPMVRARGADAHRDAAGETWHGRV